MLDPGQLGEQGNDRRTLHLRRPVLVERLGLSLFLDCEFQRLLQLIVHALLLPEDDTQRLAMTPVSPWTMRT